MLIAFNKPYGVLCQFSSADGRPTLADHISLPGVYPAGRLDLDSEGLLLLTDDGALQHAIAHPRAKLEKTYWAQVEGKVDQAALEHLRNGVMLDGSVTLPARARRIDIPAALWSRDPPVRFRKTVPTDWIELRITEGRNRQVRRMTAAVGLPTLRLVRAAIGTLTLATLQLAPGAWRAIDATALGIKVSAPSRQPHHARQR